MQEFTKKEVMDGDEMPTCEKCKCRRKCNKWLTVQRFPNILVIHIKRFSYERRGRAKISTDVRFPLPPEVLDLRRYCNPDSTQPVGAGHSPPSRSLSCTISLDLGL
jgi:ubiquitin carboxyl-terminal hydrolase 2/21